MAFQASSLLAGLLALFTLPLYTRSLTAAEFGYAETLLTLVILISILLRAGLGEAFIRHWHEADGDDARRHLVRTTSGFVLISSTLALVAGVLLAEPLSQLILGTSDATLMSAGVFGIWAFTNLEMAYALLRVSDRRRAYLAAAMQLLVSDLDEITQSWQTGGEVYEQLMAKGENGGLATMLTGMGSLAYGELAGERIRLGLLLHDPEEEQDCFSDNTLWSHYYDVQSIHNVYRGRYTRVNGSVVQGASLEAMLRANAPVEHAEMSARVESTELAMTALVEQESPYDVLIAAGNSKCEALINAVVTALIEETNTIEKIINVLDLQNVSIEGSDSLPAVNQ